MSKVSTPPRTVTKSEPAEKEYVSSPEEDGYLSPYNGSDDGSVAFTGVDGSLVDEMPPFSAFSLSPSARSLSPIELESFESSTPSSPHSRREYVGCSTPVYNTPPGRPHQQVDVKQSADGFISLDEIHARIGLTPPDINGSRTRLNLETIFEGVFLETPPKKEFQSKGNLLRRSIRNRALQYEKMEEKDSV